jgi:hypothetical protein
MTRLSRNLRSKGISWKEVATIVQFASFYEECKWKPSMFSGQPMEPKATEHIEDMIVCFEIRSSRRGSSIHGER